MVLLFFGMRIDGNLVGKRTGTGARAVQPVQVRTWRDQNSLENALTSFHLGVAQHRVLSPRPDRQTTRCEYRASLLQAPSLLQSHGWSPERDDSFGAC